MLALLVSSSTIFFVIGILLGKQYGSNKARAETPIALKIEALETGICPICNTVFRLIEDGLDNEFKDGRV